MNESVNILNEPIRMIQTIAVRVAAARRQQRLSLDQLAARAGVSKGSLAGLEKAAGNPSISLLCQVAAALGVSVADLLDTAAHRAEVFDLRGGQVLWQGERGGHARLLFGTPGPMMVELWEWVMHPGERYEARAHSAGTKEILYVLEGRLGAEAGGEEFSIGRGEGLFMETDVEHAYFCAGKKAVRFRMNVVESPGGRYLPCASGRK